MTLVEKISRKRKEDENLLGVKRPFAGGNRVEVVAGGAGGGAAATFNGMLAELLIIPPTIPILPFGPVAVLAFGIIVNDLGLPTTPIGGIGVGPVGVVGSEPVAAVVPVTGCSEGSCGFPVAFIVPSLVEIGMITSLLEKSLALADDVQNCCTSLAILKAFSSDRNISSTIILLTVSTGNNILLISSSLTVGDVGINVIPLCICNPLE
uniref:Uncharacterized protein n=1 Tax=Glossina brevipalpis TaxID=37001 RepID=A0A1A9X1Q1_9MUSC